MTDKVFGIIKKQNRRIYLQHPVHESVPFGVLLAIAGGFFDAYTFISRGGVFANAQTGNIVLLGVYAAKGEWGQALVHVPPILAFVIGVVVSESIKSRPSHFFISDWRRAVLLLEIAVLFVIGFIPGTVPNMIVTVTISFVASVQVTSFRKLVDSPFATTMSTGNLRSASQAAYIAVTKKDHEAAIRSIRYFTIVIAFIFGGFIGGLMTLRIGVRSIWGAVVVLAAAVILFNTKEYKKENIPA